MGKRKSKFTVPRLVEVTSDLPEATCPVFVTEKLHKRLKAQPCGFETALWDVFFMGQKGPNATEPQLTVTHRTVSGTAARAGRLARRSWLRVPLDAGNLLDVRIFVEKFYSMILDDDHKILWVRQEMLAEGGKLSEGTLTFGLPEESGPQRKPKNGPSGHPEYAYLGPLAKQALLEQARREVGPAELTELMIKTFGGRDD